MGVGALALAIAVAMGLAELLRPLLPSARGFAHPERLLLLEAEDRSARWAGVSPADLFALRRGWETVDDIAAAVPSIAPEDARCELAGLAFCYAWWLAISSQPTISMPRPWWDDGCGSGAVA
jgi:hypothetical protein